MQRLLLLVAAWWRQALVAVLTVLGKTRGETSESRPALQWSAFGLSDQGLRRRKQEDEFLILRDRKKTVRGVFVADGMGGQADGGVAARQAISAITECGNAAFRTICTARMRKTG